VSLDRRNREALSRAAGGKASCPTGSPLLFQSTHLVFRTLAVAVIGSVGVLVASGAVQGTSKLVERLPKLVLFPVERVELEVEWPLDEGIVRGWLPPIVGKSLLTVSGGDVARRMLEHPWVADATVRKVFPALLQIRVRSKRVAALWAKHNKLYLLSEDGRALSEAEPKHFPAVDVPVLRGADDDAAHRAGLLVLLEEVRRAVDRNGRLSELVAEGGPWLRAYVSPQRLEVRLSTENLDPQLIALSRLLDRWPTIRAKLDERYCRGERCPSAYAADVTVPERLVLAPLGAPAI
jgi:hypothetical protein